MQVSAAVLATVALLAAVAGVSVPVTSAQQPAGPPAQASDAQALTEGTAAVSGVVTDATTHRPLAGVMVYLGFQGRGAVGRLSRQISDDRGRFVFTDLPAGNNYFINASKFGYLEGHLGVGAGGLLGGLITLTDGQWFAGANIVMQRPASINGTVVDEQGEPVVGAFVRVLARIPVAGRVQLAAGQTARTDDRGVYRLADLTPGRYLVQVPSVQQSFAASMTAAELAGIGPEQLGPRPPLLDPPPALDTNGPSRLIVGSYAAPPPATGRPQAYPPMFFPRALALSGAATIELKPGENRSGIDFSLSSVPMSSVSGVVSGPADVLPGLVVRLLPEGLEDLGAGSEAATATLDASGRFTLFNVPAGSYAVDIRRTLSELQYRTPLATQPVPLPPTPGVSGSGSGSGSILSGPYGATYNTRSGRGSSAYFARTKLVVGAAPVTNLQLTLRRGASIHGRFVTDTGAPFTGSPAPLPVYAEPADGNLGLGLIASNRPTGGAFEIDGLLAGEYLLRFSVPNMSVMAVTADGEEHRFKPFDGSAGRDFDVVVTLTTKKIDLSGTAADSHGAPVQNAIVIAFPVERDQWTRYGLSPARLKGSPTSSSGTYRFQSLPAGAYYLVGVPPDQADVWQDPAKLATLAGSAVRVTLAWGDVRTENVTVVRVQ